MLKLDRYLIREFAQNTFAVLVVVWIVSVIVRPVCGLLVALLRLAGLGLSKK